MLCEYAAMALAKDLAHFDDNVLSLGLPSQAPSV